MKLTTKTDIRVRADASHGTYGRYIARRSWRTNANEYMLHRRPTSPRWVFVWDTETKTAIETPGT